MARFDLHPNRDGNGYLLDIQTDLLDRLNTRIVVPMMPVETSPQPAKRLNPVIHTEFGAYVMVTQFMAAVPVSMLKTTATNLSEHADEITNELDMVFFGF